METVGEKRKKRGQVTIFIIIGILIVAGVVAYFIVRNSYSSTSIPADIKPVYATFLSCIQGDAQTGISVLESQGGYIDLPKYVPGSGYMPFGSQLNFLGNDIPYWYYVSGNNIAATQIPSQTSMESQLANFIDSKVRNCDFQTYYSQGFQISIGNPTSSVTINNNNVAVSTTADLTIAKGNETTTISNHQITVNSPLGALYNSAQKVYNYEQQSLFLENYSIDDLRLYAPVDGVNFSCSPLTWNASQVFSNLRDAIEANTEALGINTKDSYYNVKVSLPSNQNLQFLNSKYWPNSYEVTPSQGALMSASPVGNQQGLGILGFCYVPYHFVYSVKYPVLVQVSDKNSGDIFQFPMAVVIQGNNPREPLAGQAQGSSNSQLCDYKNSQIQVQTVDSNLNPINAQISYECLGTQCPIGQAQNGTFTGNFPQCANGYVIAQAPGYQDARYLLSTISPGSLEIIMDKLYTKQINLVVDGKPYNGDASITFTPTSGSDSKIVAYPSQTSVQLSEGQYNIQVSVYQNASINVGATTKQQCISVESGVLGILGIGQQKCFNVDVPQQIISTALSGGGSTTYYFSATELMSPSALTISVPGFSQPTTLDQVQTNYNLLQNSEAQIS